MLPQTDIRGVNERDIDVLLLEEFVSSPTFLRRFLDKIDVDASWVLLCAARSVNTSNGESDLELRIVFAPRSRILALILFGA
jgi:hypothetical protein